MSDLDETPLARQYRDSRNLSNRGGLHARYATVSWFDWIAERLTPPPQATVLHVGCGPGWFWEQAVPRLPPSLRLTLVDRSPGMTAEAGRRVRALGRFAEVSAQEADAAALPFPDAAFDVVLAMHVLYHVSHIDAALDELTRVLKPSGKLFVTTNGAGDLRALTGLSLAAFGASANQIVQERFGLERAQAMFERRFAQVEVAILPDLYVIKDPADLFAYLTSMPPGGDAPPEQRDRLRRLIEETFEGGGGVLRTERVAGLVAACIPRGGQT